MRGSAAGEPTFEDERDETSIPVGRVKSRGHANEVANRVPENQVVGTAGRNKGSSNYYHQEVNENDKGMKEIGTLGSSIATDKKTYSGISSVVDKDDGNGVKKIYKDKLSFLHNQNPWTRMNSLTKHDSFGDNRKMSSSLRSNDNPEFLQRLEKTFDLFGDYILAVILKDIKKRLIHEKIFEGYQERVKEIAAENGGNIQEAAESIQNEIKEQFGDDFQAKLVEYLQTLVGKIEL
uniref:Uncharacterized protein n=1 Tax=Bracon brevicornis TaxID=1563983 RepID=A0A6V7LAD1_9HYME